MSDTPTPRTDSWKKRWNEAIEGSDYHIAAEQIIESHEQLDRELAEAINDAEAWKREAQISEARLRGEKHQDDNGIVSPSEIVTKLHIELAEITKQRDALAEYARHKMNCNAYIPADTIRKLPCSCGLEQALAATKGGCHE
jgi:hypothetical protein